MERYRNAGTCECKFDELERETVEIGVNEDIILQNSSCSQLSIDNHNGKPVKIGKLFLQKVV